MAYDDEELVALIDGELEDPRKGALLARLESDADLRRRYEALRATSAPIGAALGLPLDQAPVDRLRAFLPAESAMAPPPNPSNRISGRFAWRDLAAGLVVGFLAAAALGWLAFGFPGDRRTGARRSSNTWTSIPMRLSPSRRPMLGRRASSLAWSARGSARRFAPSTVALPGLDFKVAFILGYDGAPLAEIAYVDPSSEPVLFCILKKEGADAFPPARTARGLRFGDLGSRGTQIPCHRTPARRPDRGIRPDPGSATVTFRD